MRSSETNEIVGLIVWDFGNKYRNNTLPAWLEDVEIDVDSDILLICFTMEAISSVPFASSLRHNWRTMAEVTSGIFMCPMAGKIR
jgi:hypothetical protein